MERSDGYQIKGFESVSGSAHTGGIRRDILFRPAPRSWELTDKAASEVGVQTLQRAEAEDVPPAGEIPVEYEFPYDAFYSGYADYLDVDMEVSTYTDEDGLIPAAYFKSVGGELWLRWNFDEPGGGFGFVYDESGQVREISAEEITYQPGSSAVGLAASVFAELEEGGYEISPDGCSVTIRADYLSDCDVYSQPLFLFVRRDGSEFRLDQDNEEYDSRSILVLKNDETDLPYLEGPETYSLSSGEDCVITYHNGIGQSVYSVWYWDDVECDLTITDVGSGQFTVPHEVLRQFMDNDSNFGMTVVVQMPSDLYLFPGLYIELTD